MIRRVELHWYEAHGTGEDYPFARSQFEVVEFPQAVRRRLLALQSAG